MVMTAQGGVEPAPEQFRVVPGDVGAQVDLETFSVYRGSCYGGSWRPRALPGVGVVTAGKASAGRELVVRLRLDQLKGQRRLGLPSVTRTPCLRSRPRQRRPRGRLPRTDGRDHPRAQGCLRKRQHRHPDAPGRGAPPQGHRVARTVLLLTPESRILEHLLKHLRMRLGVVRRIVRLLGFALQSMGDPLDRSPP